MLHGQICPVTAVVTAVGVAAISIAASKAKDKPKAAMFGSVAALLFAAQMLNFPVQYGTSGHLLGGVLVSAILGIPFGILAMSLVLTMQAFLFSDGGLSALGANILNMAILGVGLGGFLRICLMKYAKNDLEINLSTAFAAWVSVMLAALACSVELAISGHGSISSITKAMLSVHAFIGLGEAVITVALVRILSSAPKAVLGNRYSWGVLGSALSFVLLSPFVCQWPDGLEWVAKKYSFFHEMAPAFVTPFANYSIPMITNPFWTTAASGALGTLAVFTVGMLLIKFLPRISIH
jgi:cobalt/nickel transport system permease protein